MTSVFASRRRAEEFSSLIEGAVEGSAPGEARDARTREFLEIVESLRDVPVPGPRPEFVSSLREELMTAAETLLVPGETERLRLPTRSPTRDRRMAAVIGGVAAVGATASMAVASQGALPGEILYPVKRAIEDVGTGLANDPDAKAMRLLDQASSRLAEVSALSREGGLEDSSTVSAGLTDFRAQATEASELLLDEYDRTGEADLVSDLRDFTAASMGTLEQLESQVPESARGDLVDAARVVSEIDAQAERLCPSCGGVGVDQIPPVLLAAADAAGAQVRIVPDATAEPESSASDSEGRAGRGGKQQGDDPREGGSKGAGKGTGGSTPSPVTTPPEDGAGTGGGSGDAGPDGPLSALTDLLPDPAPATTPKDTRGGGGKKGKNTLKDTVKNTVKDPLKDTVDGLDDTVDELTDPLDPLLGN